MVDKTEAFFKGGCGCIIGFVVIGLFCVLIGGSMHIDIGGVICLFVLGGIIGLIVLTIYNKGVRQGREPRHRFDDGEWDE